MGACHSTTKEIKIASTVPKKSSKDCSKTVKPCAKCKKRIRQEHLETTILIERKNKCEKRDSRIKYFDHSRRFKIVVSYTKGNTQLLNDVKTDIRAAYPRAYFETHTVPWPNYLHLTTKGKTVFCTKDGDGIYTHNK